MYLDAYRITDTIKLLIAEARIIAGLLRQKTGRPHTNQNFGSKNTKAVAARFTDLANSIEAFGAKTQMRAAMIVFGPPVCSKNVPMIHDAG